MCDFCEAVKKLFCRACVASGIPLLIALADIVSPSVTLEAMAARALGHLWEG